LHIAIIFKFLNIVGIFPFSRILLKKAVSHNRVRTSQCLKNSGNIPSLPAYFPIFIFSIADFISSTVKGAVITDLWSASLLSFDSLDFVSFENCLCNDALDNPSM